MYRERKDFQLMKIIKPKLIEDIRTWNINLLNLAISDSINISFELRLLSDAKKLKQLIIKEQQCDWSVIYLLFVV